MTERLLPDLSVAVKLASIAVHADEMMGPNGHSADASAINALLADPEVRAYLDKLGQAALLPVKRRG